MPPNAAPALPGQRELGAAIAELETRLPERLRALAGVAFDYRWSWTLEGTSIFSAIDARRFERVDHNPVRLLRETPRTVLEKAAADDAFVARVASLASEVAAARTHGDEHPGLGTVAFLCSEFGVHRSLPCYSGGLGVLAGDILKEASDRGLPFVGVGLMYRRGYFHQRVDLGGKQHEYWVEIDPDALPTALVTDDDGEPITVSVRVRGEDIVALIWRVDVGRVPLYLLDADHEANSVIARWTSSRLYEGNRTIRLAQYALLGVGAIRALRALGIEPSIVHLNEGHPALSALALADPASGAGALDTALAAVRDRLVFTTHTPVPAGNETYSAGEMLDSLGGLLDELGAGRDEFLGLARVRPADTREQPGMTPFAIRAARSTNGVSELHGKVARAMWAPMFIGSDDDHVPITHVTNGVHLPTWMSPPMRRLLGRHLGQGWEDRAANPATWEPVERIPDAELWALRTELRRHLVAFVRDRSVHDRLARGESIDYVAAAADAFDPDRLTVGFARRLATYKRLHLLSLDPGRALRVLGDRLQFVFAGKAHPLDEEAKLVAARLFELKNQPGVGSHVAFIEDYDLSVAPALVAGCDVWLNLPRPPYEASGTSGMKAALNGGLNVSSLDGWWVEAYDGTNGWAVDGGDGPGGDEGRDRRDARALFDVVEGEVEPLFYDRGRDGVPHGWIQRVKATLRTIGPRFCATRMMGEYEGRIYAAEPRRVGASQSTS